MTTLVNTKTGEVVDQLTAMERSALTHAEATIEQGIRSFIAVGEALAKVRDERLYREDFGTFDTYCRERWNITDRRARQMIDAAAITEALPTGTTVPVNEGQARELVGLEPEAAADVMQRAHEATAGKVTASAIRDARAPLTPTEHQEREVAVRRGITHIQRERDHEVREALADTQYPFTCGQSHCWHEPVCDRVRPPGVSAPPTLRQKSREEIDREELEHGIRTTVTRIAECIRHLDAQDPAVYIAEFHPHSDRYLASGMRPDPTRIARAIDFLTALQKEIDK